MSSAITITGVDELRARLRRLPELVRPHIAQAHAATGEQLVAGAQARAPKFTGRLREKLSARVSADGARVNISLETPRPFYWYWVEFGTSKMAARPFLLPTVDAERSAHVSRLEAAIGRAVQALEGK